MPELVNHQRSEEWLAARQGRITASLAAATLGLCPYRSRQAAWREITGLRTEAEERRNALPNRHIQWGVQFEAAARLDYEAETGHLVTETGFWVHPEHDWLGASPDGLIGDDGLCEVKCPMNAPRAVPIHSRIQCLIQLAVTGRQWVDYYAWGAESVNGRHKFYLARVYPAGLDGLIRRLREFYDLYIITGTPPPRARRKKCIAPGAAATT